MTKRTGGSRRRTRYRFGKRLRERGKTKVTRHIQSFSKGDHVFLCADSAYQKGIYHKRHHGLMGTISKKRGGCYEVMIKDLKKTKMLIIHPAHLKKA